MQSYNTHHDQDIQNSHQHKNLLVSLWIQPVHPGNSPHTHLFSVLIGLFFARR